MALLSQFAWIFGFSLLGEILHAVLPLPIPTSVYGLVLMFTALTTGLLKLKQVEKAADIMVEMMPFFFVPPGVSLITVWADVSGVMLPFVVTVALSTVLVMAITGIVTQVFIRLKRKGGAHE